MLPRVGQVRRGEGHGSEPVVQGAGPVGPKSECSVLTYQPFLPKALAGSIEDRTVLSSIAGSTETA